MFVPTYIIITVLVLIVPLIAATILSTFAWYGILCEREDDRHRLMRGGWTCDDCGRAMRFVGDTVEGRAP